MAWTAASIAAALKTVFANEFDRSALVRKSPLLTQIEHETDFYGSSYDWTVQYGRSGGRSRDVTVAEANAVGDKYARFSVGCATDYLYMTFNGLTARKTVKGNNATQFTEMMKQSLNGALGNLNDEIARNLYNSATGSRALVASFSTTSCVLTYAEDAIFFAVGDQVSASATDGGAVLGGAIYVTLTNVDTATGTLTASTNWSTLTGFAAGNYLLARGDLNLAMYGLGSYCPSATPSGGDSFGLQALNRSVDPEKLAGLRFTTGSYTLETLWPAAQAYADLRPGDGFQKARFYVNSLDFASLQIAKEGSRWVDNDNSYGIGVQSFRAGTSTIVPDNFCPRGQWFFVAPDAISLKTVGDQPDLDNLDGNDIRKIAGDVYAAESIVDGNIIAMKPYGIMRGTVPTA